MTTQERQADFVGVHTRANDDGSYEITIAANNVARDNLDVDLDSLKLENYLRNPVVLWSHDMTIPPIGRSVSVRKADGKLTTRFEFAKGYQLAEDIRSLWDQGILRAASIRWGGGEVSYPDSGPLMRFKDSELIEWSIVPVGSDPDALRQAARSLRIPMTRLMAPTPTETRMTKPADVRAEEDEEMATDPPAESETEDEEPTLADLAAAIAALDERETAFDDEIIERVKRLEGDEEEPEEEPEPEVSDDMAEPDEEERQVAADIDALLGMIRER